MRFKRILSKRQNLRIIALFYVKTIEEIDKDYKEESEKRKKEKSDKERSARFRKKFLNPGQEQQPTRKLKLIPESKQRKLQTLISPLIKNILREING